MAGSPSSLASLLGNTSGRQDGSVDSSLSRAGGTEAALLDFIQENYANEAEAASNGVLPLPHASTFHPAPLAGAASGPNSPSGHRAPQPLSPGQGAGTPRSGVPFRRSASPVDPSIPIPPALAEIAAGAGPSLHLNLPNADAVIDASFAYNQYGERGEMGGKRKKAPHERAGWREMDEFRGRKRGRKAGNQTAQSDSAPASSQAAPPRDSTRDFTGYDPGQHAVDEGRYGGGEDDGHEDLTLASASTLERDLAAAHAEMGLAVGLSTEDGAAIAGAFEDHGVAHSMGDGSQQIVPGEVTLIEADDAETRDKSKTGSSRAEQNRRAQQVYRRKREERMKQLEAAAAALEPTRRIASDLGIKLKQLAVSFEAAKIENAALRMALLTASQPGNIPILTSDGTLLINSGMQPASAPNRQEEVTAAFEKLERQSRELAKQNRAKQGHH